MSIRFISIVSDAIENIITGHKDLRELIRFTHLNPKNVFEKYASFSQLIEEALLHAKILRVEWGFQINAVLTQIWHSKRSNPWVVCEKEVNLGTLKWELLDGEVSLSHSPRSLWNMEARAFFTRSILWFIGAKRNFFIVLERCPEDCGNVAIKSRLVGFFLYSEHWEAFVMRPKIVSVVCSTLPSPSRNQRLQSVLSL